MITFEGRREPTGYRLPIQGDNVLFEQLVVAAELHLLQYRLGCCVSCAIVGRAD